MGTWLYRVATNRCLNALRSASRRPRTGWSVPDVEPLEPTRRGEGGWLGPHPDPLPQGVPGDAPRPEAPPGSREGSPPPLLPPPPPPPPPPPRPPLPPPPPP